MAYVFKSPFIRLSVHLKPHEERVVGGLLVITPATMAHFEGGIYKTDDEEIAALIRKCPSFKLGQIVELSHEMQEMLEPPEKPARTFRGPISTATLKGEAGVPDEPKKGISICDYPGCGKEFAEDLTGNKLRAHKVTHRIAESKAETGEVKIEER